MTGFKKETTKLMSHAASLSGERIKMRVFWMTIPTYWLRVLDRQSETRPTSRSIFILIVLVPIFFFHCTSAEWIWSCSFALHVKISLAYFTAILSRSCWKLWYLFGPSYTSHQTIQSTNKQQTTNQQRTYRHEIPEVTPSEGFLQAPRLFFWNITNVHLQ